MTPPSTSRLSTSAKGDALRGLNDRLDGGVSRPGDERYRTARPWNRAVLSEPRAVVHAASARDVMAAMQFARTHQLRVAVRSTGHGALPVGADVLLLHTAAMADCEIDPHHRRARVGAGAVWQQVIDAATPHGLAPICGAAPAIGVVGYLTGGGLGPLSRTYGVSSDYVRALEVVTGDGQLRRATATEHEDLFWGLRGGKATLGIVTSVELDLVALDRFYGGCLWFDAADARAVLHRWRRMCDELPEAGGTSAAILQLPPLSGLPVQIAGRPTLAVRVTWTGDPAVGARRFDVLRAAATPVLDDVRVRPFAQIGQVHCDPVTPMPTQEHSALLHSLTDQALDDLLAAVNQPDNRQTVVELRLLGGAIARPARNASAFCHRDAAYSLFTAGPAMPDSTVTRGHAEQIIAAMSRYITDGVLANFTASADPQQIRRYYDKDALHWLTALGEQYDPDHVLDTGQVVRTAPQSVVADRTPEDRELARTLHGRRS